MNSLRNLPTTRLLALYRDGRAEALDVLFGRHYDRVRRVVAVRTGFTRHARFELADVAQEAFLKAMQSLDGYERREEAQFVDWVCEIAANALRDEQRKHRAQIRDVTREVSAAAVTTESRLAIDQAFARETRGLVERLAQAEEAQILDECLGGLPEEHREVLLLRYYLEGSWGWIGERLGKSAAAAEQLARRAKVHLASALSQRLDAEPG